MLQDPGERSVSIIELAGDPDKLSIEDLKKAVCPECFTLIAFIGTKRNYTLNFEKEYLADQAESE